MVQGTQPLEIYTWSEKGYKPLVFSREWQVALLNWEPIHDPGNLSEIERHCQTDEVFILWRGHGALCLATTDGLQVVDMEPGIIYNVTQGTWHGLVATRDASWIIIEGRDTHLHDTEIRPMTEAELVQLRAQLPDWLTRSPSSRP